MGLKVDDKGNGDFKKVAPGTYPAICFRLIDLGTQHGEYQGKPNARRQILVGWELPGELIEDGDLAGQPHGISKFYTASLGEKANLRKDLESWRGRAFTEQELKGFDLNNILGKPCLVSVIHNENGKAKVSGVMAMPKGMPAPQAINKPQTFDLDDYSQAAFDALPDGIKNIIKESDEYKARQNGGGTIYDREDPPIHDDDDIPF